MSSRVSLRSARVILPCCLAALLLTALGLERLTVLHRSVVIPNYPQDLSNVVDARGFPLAWLVVGPAEIVAPLSGWTRFLAGRFAACWLFYFLIVWTVTGGAFRLRWLLAHDAT